MIPAGISYLLRAAWPRIVLALLVATGCNSILGFDEGWPGGPGGGAPTGEATGGTAGSGAGGDGASGGGVGGGGAGGGGGGSTGYAQAVLADGPVAYWRLGETSGLIAADSSGNGLDLVYLGGYTQGVAGLQTSDGNPAVELDGIDGLLQGGDALDFDSVTAFSAEAWVKMDEIPAPGTHAGIVGKRDTDGQGYQGWALRINDTGTVFMTVWRDDSASWCFSTSLPAGIPTHVVGVYDNGTMRVYVNGVEDGVQTGVPQPVDTAGVLEIGLDGDDDHFGGVIDEVALYDEALPPDRIAEHVGAAN